MTDTYLNYIIVFDLTIITIFVIIFLALAIKLLYGLNKIIKAFTGTVNNIKSVSHNLTHLSLIPKTLSIKLSELITFYVDDIISKKKESLKKQSSNKSYDYNESNN